jgi:hypothetical protein
MLGGLIWRPISAERTSCFGSWVERLGRDCRGCTCSKIGGPSGRTSVIVKALGKFDCLRLCSEASRPCSGPFLKLAMSKSLKDCWPHTETLEVEVEVVVVQSETEEGLPSFLTDILSHDSLQLTMLHLYSSQAYPLHENRTRRSMFKGIECSIAVSFTRCHQHDHQGRDVNTRSEGGVVGRGHAAYLTQCTGIYRVRHCRMVKEDFSLEYLRFLSFTFLAVLSSARISHGNSVSSLCLFDRSAFHRYSDCLPRRVPWKDHRLVSKSTAEAHSGRHTNQGLRTRHCLALAYSISSLLFGCVY